MKKLKDFINAARALGIVVGVMLFFRFGKYFFLDYNQEPRSEKEASIMWLLELLGILLLIGGIIAWRLNARRFRTPKVHRNTTPMDLKEEIKNNITRTSK